jgi:TonB family protein
MEEIMTNGVVTYRPGPKWSIVTAFVAAATIHLSAVAIASLYYETPITQTKTPFAPVDFFDSAPNPSPPNVEVPLPSPAPPVARPDFAEPQTPAQPVPKRQSFVPIRAMGQTPLAAVRNPKAFALTAPRPEYPYEARSRHITGSGVAVISVEPTTGVVTNATMEQSIGNAILDNSTLSAFRRWRFKTGTPPKVRIPITFLSTGASY